MDDLRSWCRGVAPLPGRLIDWQRDVLGRGQDLASLLEEHGSPLNLIDPAPLGAHADELVAAASDRGVDLRVFFARKANKALALVDAALDAGHGIDVASDAELSQVLDRGASSERVIVTAAVKQRALVERAVEAGVVISLDNLDELALVREVAEATGRVAKVGLRLTADHPVPSRFGLSVAAWTKTLGESDSISGIDVQGIHFHVHGYAAEDRVRAMADAIELMKWVRAAGFAGEWIDIGGGVPMNYIDEPDDWDRFWTTHRIGLESGNPITWNGHGLGLRLVDAGVNGRLEGVPAVYPVAQTPVRGAWLAGLLDGRLPGGGTVADELRNSGLRLHVEPGRSLLDGCGLTAARVESRKQRSDGTWLITLAMNRTQCRSAADDFLVDPILLPTGDRSRTTGPIEGYLVGAYCIENELLTWRRLHFPRGVAVGDLVVFVNTAGYQMHILESASHQIPLARNVVPDGQDGWRLDLIDADPSVRQSRA